MTSYIRKRIPAWGRVASAAMLMIVAVHASAAAKDDVEAQKAKIVRTALEKLGRPTDNPALFEAAREADALTGIEVAHTDGETVIRITTTGEPVYRHFVLEAENKLVVDFYNTVNLRHNETFEAPDSPVVERVRTSLFKLDPQFVSRVVVDMNRLVGMRVDRADSDVVVHVPAGAVLPEVEPLVPSAESIVVTRLKEALAEQRAQVAEAEARLEQETRRRVEAEKELQAALAAKAEETGAAIEAERAELAKAREELEAQIAQRAAKEAELKDKLAATETELARAVEDQKKAIADAETRLHEEESKRVETESRFVEMRDELEQHRNALAKLETALDAARTERDRVEKSLKAELTDREAEARAQLDERQKVLDETVAALDEERKAKAALAASLQEEIAAEQQAAELALAEQKSALAELELELEAARKQIDATKEKLAIEEATKAEFEKKLAEREAELESTLDEQNRALEDARAKLAREAEVRTAAEDRFKQELDKARRAAQQETARLEKVVGELEEQLAEEQSKRGKAEQELRAQLAKREKQTGATIADLQSRIEEAERAAAEKEQLAREIEAEKTAQVEQTQQELAATREELAEREQRLAELEKKLVEAQVPAAVPPFFAKPSGPVQPPEDTTVSLTFRDMDISSALDILARKANINILAGQDVKGTVTARLNNVPLLQALDIMLRDNGYGYVIEDGIYRVVPLDYPQQEGMRTEYIRLSNADAADVQTTLKDLVSPSGGVVANKSANAVIIFDLKENVDRLREIVGQLDASLEGVSWAPGEAGMVTRSFMLSQADAGDVSKTIEGLLSPKGKLAANESANMIIVTDRIERVDEIAQLIDQLDVQSPVVDLESGIFKLSYADAGEMARLLEDVVTDIGSVVPDARSNQIIVTDTPANFQLIEGLIPELDQRVPQVYIQVMIVDVVLNDDAQYGAKWLANAILKQTRDLKSFSFGSSAGDLATAALPALDAAEISFGIVGNDVDITAVIAAEVQDRDARIIANPDILVLNNRIATIEIVQEIPFQELTQTTQGPPVSSTEFKDIGVTLTVEPQITHDQSIILHMSPEESSISGYSNTGIPIEDSRRADTTLLINDGATVYIGGLRNISKSIDVSKVPVLGDIPYVGYIFRNSKIADHRTELMVFLTAHIIAEELPGLTPDEQRKFDQMGELSDVPDATRDLLEDIASPVGIREPLWRMRRKVELPRTK